MAPGAYWKRHFWNNEGIKGKGENGKRRQLGRMQRCIIPKILDQELMSVCKNKRAYEWKKERKGIGRCLAYCKKQRMRYDDASSHISPTVFARHAKISRDSWRSMLFFTSPSHFRSLTINRLLPGGSKKGRIYHDTFTTSCQFKVPT